VGKRFDVIMTGLSSGIVAITTTYLGLAGTIIGAVLGSVIYQIFSSYIKDSINESIDKTKESLDRNNLQLLEDNIVFIIPLILIIIVEIIFIFSFQYNYTVFKHLERITDYNLFRAIGVGLTILGLYSIVRPKKGRVYYGIILLFISIFFLIRGFIDTRFIYQLIYPYSTFFTVNDANDLGMDILIVVLLSFISIKIFYDSIIRFSNEKIKNNNISNNNEENDNQSLNKNDDADNFINKINKFYRSIIFKKENISRNDVSKNKDKPIKNININNSSKDENIPFKLNNPYLRENSSRNVSENEKTLIENIGRYSKKPK
jgi:hypothetical protein